MLARPALCQQSRSCVLFQSPWAGVTPTSRALVAKLLLNPVILPQASKGSSQLSSRLGH